MAVAAPSTDNDATDIQNMEQDDDDDDKGVQIRISFHLATEYQNVVPSLHVPTDIIAVPADIHRKGLSTIINHLLDRHDNDDGDDMDDDDDDNNSKLRTIPFEFMIGNSSRSSSNNNSTLGHRLLRSTGGIEREVRKLGLSLEEAIPVTYFPAQLPPEPSETDPEPPLPDWIGTMECIDANENMTSLLCTGCYDGSILVLDASRNSEKNSDSMDVPLTLMATKPLAHNGPIHCLSTTKVNDEIYITSGSMDHSLRFRILSKQSEKTHDPLYAFDDARIVDCCINGHTAAISSVDTITTFSSTLSTSDASKLFYIASGDFDGNVGLWEYPHHNAMSTEDDDGLPRSSKKSKSTTPRNDTALDEASTTTPIMKKISTKSIFRAHTSQVSGVAFGNFEKVQASSSFLPKQLITGSWDHSIKVWDMERQDNISTINGQRVVTCLDTSYHTSGVVVTGHPDCTIRLWDTRTTATTSKDASSITVSDTTFKPSHKEWVSCVKWSPMNPYHIVSTSYDGTMKLWDIRTSLPLYTVRTFPSQEKGLSVCYSSWKSDTTNYLFAGGTDCIVKKYKLL